MKKDQKSASGLQSFLKHAKFDRVPVAQFMDNSAIHASEPSLAGKDIDLGLSSLLGARV